MYIDTGELWDIEKRFQNPALLVIFVPVYFAAQQKRSG